MNLQIKCRFLIGLWTCSINCKRQKDRCVWQIHCWVFLTGTGTRPAAVRKALGKPVSNTMTLQRLSEVHIIHKGPDSREGSGRPSSHIPPQPPYTQYTAPPHTHIPNPPGLSVLNPFSHGYQTEGVPRRPIITSFQNNSPSPLSLSPARSLSISLQ